MRVSPIEHNFSFEELMKIEKVIESNMFDETKSIQENEDMRVISSDSSFYLINYSMNGVLCL